MENLEKYIELNVNVDKGSKYYNEDFCNTVMNYLGAKGYELSDEDEKFLEDNGYSLEDFED